MCSVFWVKRGIHQYCKVLSGAAVVVQRRQVTNHCYVLAIWEQLETPVIICQGQQFVGATVHYDGLALQLKVS